MKSIILGLAFFVSLNQAQASTASLAKASASKVLLSLENDMKKAGYSLKSISDVYAGEVFFPQCDCEEFTLTFQKSSGDPFKGTVKTETKEFNLTINGSGYEYTTPNTKP